jgi:lactoylglutathione lyase
MRLRYEVFHQVVFEVVRFYVEALRFEMLDHQQDDFPEYATLRRDDVQVGCCEFPDAVTAPRRPPRGSEIVLVVDDLDAEYAAVRAAGYELADDLTRRPWGLRDFRLFDPTGQYLRVTE